MSFLPILSSAMGWAYFICWGVALYPPILLNSKLKSVEGMSLDFVVLNMVGYVAYTTSLIMLYFNDRVRNQYAQRHSLTDSGQLKYPLVRFNDVIYGAHGSCLVAYTLYQIYGLKYARAAGQHISKYTKLILLTLLFAFCLLGGYAVNVQDNLKTLESVDLAMILGNIKVLMSTAKYVPQVLHNRRRRSTKGWSMDAVRLDICGGLLSLAQLFLDGYIRDDLSGVWNNSVKLCLSVITITFDIIFCIQHYYLYPPDNDSVESLAEKAES